MTRHGPLRIALDGLPLQVRSAGIARYTDFLVRAMATARPEIQFVLLGLSDLAQRLLRAVVSESEPGDSVPPNVSWANSSLYPLITGYPIIGLPRLVPVQWATGAIDLYHATNYVLPRNRIAPAVVTVHDLTLLRFPALGTGPLRRLVANTRRSVTEARLVIADSESTRRDVCELLAVRGEKVRVVHLGHDPYFCPGSVEAAREHVARRFDLHAPFVLHVGTIEPRKNLMRLASAFAQARKQNRLPHHLVLAGSPGWGLERLGEKIHAMGLTEVVCLPGSVAKDELRSLYRAADLFVYPSLYEGFGLPPLEAMACGTPTVVSNAASLPEVVGDNAWLVDPLDEPGLSDAVVRCLTDDSLRHRLRTGGLDRAQKFTWERCAKETLAVYEEAMHR